MSDGSEYLVKTETLYSLLTRLESVLRNMSTSLSLMDLKDSEGFMQKVIFDPRCFCGNSSIVCEW